MQKTARFIASAVSAAGLLAGPALAGECTVYFGTCTKGKSASEGICFSRLNLETGKLSPPELAVEVTNPFSGQTGIGTKRGVEHFGTSSLAIKRGEKPDARERMPSP